MTDRCIPCNRSFRSRQALQQHLDSPVHRPRSSNTAGQPTPPLRLEAAATVSGTIVEYVGISRSSVAPVFAVARRLRFKEPTVDDVLRRVRTELEHTVIAALISAALRLLPVDKSLQGLAKRTEQHRIKAAQAKHAEDSFCSRLTSLGYVFLRESQQLGEAATPDIRFSQSVSICGHMCLWLEYKNYFGFRENPFVTASERKQFRKYATQIGPGAVVYKLGFETNHVNVDGVMMFRETELLQALRRR